MRLQRSGSGLQECSALGSTVWMLVDIAVTVTWVAAERQLGGEVDIDPTSHYGRHWLGPMSGSARCANASHWLQERLANSSASAFKFGGMHHITDGNPACNSLHFVLLLPHGDLDLAKSASAITASCCVCPDQKQVPVVDSEHGGVALAHRLLSARAAVCWAQPHAWAVPAG